MMCTHEASVPGALWLAAKPAASAGGGHGKLASARGALKFTLWKLGLDAALSRLKSVQDASFM